MDATSNRWIRPKNGWMRLKMDGCNQKWMDAPKMDGYNQKGMNGRNLK
jgi:hypothetical protein